MYSWSVYMRRRLHRYVFCDLFVLWALALERKVRQRPDMYCALSTDKYSDISACWPTSVLITIDNYCDISTDMTCVYLLRYIYIHIYIYQYCYMCIYIYTYIYIYIHFLLLFCLYITFVYTLYTWRVVWQHIPTEVRSPRHGMRWWRCGF